MPHLKFLPKPPKLLSRPDYTYKFFLSLTYATDI